MLRSLRTATLFLFVLAGVMVFTNPNQDTYVSYATNKLSKELPDSVCQTPDKLPLWLRSIAKATSETCKSGLASGLTSQKDTFKQVLSESTERQNYQVLSVYTTEIPGYTVKTVGVLGQFITVSGGNKEA